MKVIKGNIVDVVSKKVYPGVIEYAERITRITQVDEKFDNYILPGLIDSHVHIESSMLSPVEFARAAVRSGVVATVSDPHEISNVCGEDGFDFMLKESEGINFNFNFVVPSCVPATNLESSGASLGVIEVARMLRKERVVGLAEMMNFPGVLFNDRVVHGKLTEAKKLNLPIDGHAPGLSGDDLIKYAKAGITTDHECSTLNEALEKINLGMKIQIREGSAARNLNNLISLFDTHPESIMVCTDDCHPGELLSGYLLRIIREAVISGANIYNVLRACTVNPINHYKLNVGLLQKNDFSDFIVVDNLRDFNVSKTVIRGETVYSEGESKIESKALNPVNNFKVGAVDEAFLHVNNIGTKVKVIKAIEGELITEELLVDSWSDNKLLDSSIEKDYLKLVVVNRYSSEVIISVAFINGFGLKSGALASSIAHDSHNVIAVGTNNIDLISAINAVIRHKGGVSFSNGTKNEILPLEIAGLMTNKPAEHVRDEFEKINQLVKESGCKLNDPFMTLSFMSLLVIPKLKLGDKGLFDVGKFEFTPMFV